MLAAQGLNNSQIGADLEVDFKTVRKWRSRFHDHRVDGLDDLPRPGRPLVFEASQRQELFTLATSAPPRPLGRWTVDLLAEHLVESGIVPCISRETVSFWLRTAEYIAYHNGRAKPYQWTTRGKPLVGVEVNRSRRAGKRSRNIPRRSRMASRY